MTELEFEDIYHRLLPVVYGYFLRRVCDVPTAEDLTQETFLSAARNMSTDVVDLGPWITVIARRRLIDHLRRTSRRPMTLPGQADFPGPTWPPDCSDGERAVSIALARLPTDQRLALILRYIDDLTVKEVAHELNRTLIATESLLARSRKALRRKVQEVDVG